MMSLDVRSSHFMIHRDFHRERMDGFLREKLAGSREFPCGRMPPSLTVSRQCGAGTSRIGRQLVEYLDTVDESAVNGWAFFDQSLIGKIIEEDRIPDRLHPSHCPEKVKFPRSPKLAHTLEQPRSAWTLFNFTATTIRSLCGLGSAVVAGRAGNFVTADLDNTFHVRLIGSENKRVTYVRNRFQLSSEEAEKLVRKTDQARARFVRRFADAGVDDPSAYHLILNTDDLPDHLIVRIIGDSLVEWSHEGPSNPECSGELSNVISGEKFF